MTEPVLYAAMESSGTWYAPTVKAHSMLGRRASGEGLMSSSDVAAQIETCLGEYLPKNGTGHAPTRQTVIKWERDFPGYPEWALDNGLINRSVLLPWAQSQMKIKGKNSSRRLPRKQGRGTKYSTVTMIIADTSVRRTPRINVNASTAWMRTTQVKRKRNDSKNIF